MTALAPLLTSFLRVHLPQERSASPHTAATYAHSFTLLVRFAAAQLKKRPSDLNVEDLDPPLILAFLDHIEQVRGNSGKSRNARLASIRAFFRYIEYHAPECLEQALRIRSIPRKRTDEALIDHLTREEIQALLDAPDAKTWSGARDHAMLHMAYAAGLRVSELLSLRTEDFVDRDMTCVRIMGKGRRERVLPLWRETRRTISLWLSLRSNAAAPELFLNKYGERMSRDGFAHRLKLHVAKAAERQPSLKRKRVTPHVLRHSCAMHTLEATGDIRKVALWLGHASIQSTEAYLRVDPAEKLAVLNAVTPPTLRPGKFKPPSDELLAMLGEVRGTT